MRKMILLLMVTLTIASCKKDQYYLYNDVARIQFGPATNQIYDPAFNLADTLKPITFFYDEPSVTEDTVFFDIYAIGRVASTDRSFTLEQVQVNNTLNAVSGTHYVAFNDPKASKYYVIKAGSSHTKVPIIVLRDPSLKTSSPVLKFNVVADGNFQNGEIKNLWRKVVMTDRLSQPAAWNATVTLFFGKYSVEKHKFMIKTTGDKWDQVFLTYVLTDFSLVQYYQAIFQTAIVDYNKAHPGAPMRDENQELITFP
ncbi:DUF4843 domain-containing protein [Pedobacter hiemivivus]|uniref:DUF4843 domain-containing protein n=1 Tax=Pedobacter hiemivivus TaxID=2530454 RepID=A0A4R0NGJ0_9SPHI|nr:DUF4843 domain-containing protein [Pedobacter hiemivivus]TCC99651.1 DUF4843 domain-containing protein [Pedobacter hiemivivus]